MFSSAVQRAPLNLLAEEMSASALLVSLAVDSFCKQGSVTAVKYHIPNILSFREILIRSQFFSESKSPWVLASSYLVVRTSFLSKIT